MLKIGYNININIFIYSKEWEQIPLLVLKIKGGKNWQV